MKITHIIESSGGSADFVIALVKLLPRHQHTIIYSDRTFGNKFQELQTTFSSTRFLYWKYAQREINIIKDLKATISLYQLLRSLKSDVIHAHSSKAGFLGRIVCYLQKKKNLIYTPHGLAFLRLDVSPFKRKVYILFEKIAYRLTGRIISCSKSEADSLIREGMMSEYINNGTEIFNYSIPASRSDSTIVIATIGRVTNQKNPSLFNEIAKNFEHLPNFKFLWIGGGELEHELTASNIRITGWVDRMGVTQNLATTDLYLSTALWEGLPFAVLEAMNMRKPLLLKDCVGNIDLVRNDFNGCLFHTAQEAIGKINYFYNHPEIRDEYGNNSFTLVSEEFNLTTMAGQYEQVYYSYSNEINSNQRRLATQDF